VGGGGGGGGGVYNAAWSAAKKTNPQKTAKTTSYAFGTRLMGRGHISQQLHHTD